MEQGLLGLELVGVKRSDDLLPGQVANGYQVVVGAEEQLALIVVHILNGMTMREILVEQFRPIFLYLEKSDTHIISSRAQQAPVKIEAHTVLNTLQLTIVASLLAKSAWKRYFSCSTLPDSKD